MTLPAGSVTVSASVFGSTLTTSASVRKPSLVGVTAARLARTSCGTAQLASSGKVPSRATRTRTIASVSAVTRSTVAPRRASMPLACCLISPAALGAGAGRAWAAIPVPINKATASRRRAGLYIHVTPRPPGKPGGSRLGFRQSAAPPPVGRRRGRGGMASEFRAHPELEAAIDPAPRRVHIDRLYARRRRRIAENFLLIDGGCAKQVGAFDRQLEMVVDRVADRSVEEARRLLEHWQTDTAIEILRQVTRPPVIGEPQRDRPLFIKPDDVEGVLRDAGKAMRIDHVAVAAGGRLASALRADIATRSGVDQVRVVDPRLMDIGVV